MKKKILVDLDGVGADFEGHRYKLLSERGLPVLLPEEVTSFYGSENYKERHGEVAEEAAKAVTREPGFFRNMPLIPGFVNGLYWLNRMGHAVRTGYQILCFSITTCP